MLLFLLSLGVAPKEIIFQLAQPNIHGTAAENVASSIANITDLDPNSTRRIFRHAGRFEARHIEFGLDR